MKKIIIGHCGVCCNHCGMQMRIPKMAKELKSFVEAYRHGERIGYITREFNFKSQNLRIHLGPTRTAQSLTFAPPSIAEKYLNYLQAITLRCSECNPFG